MASRYPAAALSDAVSFEPPANAVSPWVALRSASFHPFIYKRMLRAADPAARPGDLVQVYDKSGALFGRGLYHPRSQIAVRMLAHGDTAVGDSFFQERVNSAVELRRILRIDESTDAYRLVHAEADGLSGLVVERYADCLAFEVFSLGMFQRLALIERALIAALGPPASLDRPGKTSPAWRVIVRADADIERIEGFRATDAEPRNRADALTQVTIREHGVRFRVDLATGHKTGFFCDQRDNRRRFAGLCRDADVLDLCCYTGGFALAAKLLGQAKHVTAVDLDEAALAVARDNVNLNNTRIDLVHSDAFNYLRQMIANGRQFDRVVLDPPKLAPTRDDVPLAEKKYFDLNALAAQVVRPGGLLLTCSCSGLISTTVFNDIVTRALRRAGREAQRIDQSAAAADHPVALNCPETSYLKAIWLRIS